MTEPHAIVEIVDEDGTVLHSYSYGQPTPEAAALMEALVKAIDEEGKKVAATGKVPDLKDVVSAMIGVLGSFIAGIEPEAARKSVFEQCGVLLQLAISTWRSAAVSPSRS